MEEEKDPSPEYLKAFNNGYIIAQEEPMIAELLATAKGDAEALLAFRAGCEEWVNPHYLKSKLPAFLQDDPFKSHTNELDKGKDKNMDIEPEH